MTTVQLLGPSACTDDSLPTDVAQLCVLSRQQRQCFAARIGTAAYVRRPSLSLCGNPNRTTAREPGRFVDLVKFTVYLPLRLAKLTLSGRVLEGIPGTTQAAELSHAGVCTEARGRRGLLAAALAPSARAHGRARAVDQVLAGRAAELALDQVDLVDDAN